MGLFKSSKPLNDEKLPLFAFRGRNEQTGKKQNYLLRWGCETDECEGLFRAKSKAGNHKGGHKGGKK
jgi:hypothetical protein